MKTYGLKEREFMPFRCFFGLKPQGIAARKKNGRDLFCANVHQGFPS